MKGRASRIGDDAGARGMSGEILIPLSHLCTAIVDCEHKTAPTEPAGTPLVRTTNIKNGRIDFESCNRISEGTYILWTHRMEPKPSDLILAREAPVGEVGIIPSGMRACLGQRTVLIRPNPEFLEPRYLLYLLLTSEMRHEMACRAEGSTVPHLNMSDIRALEIPEPPSRDTQRAIASTLGTLDDKIEINRQMNATLEAIGQAIFQHWFVDFEFPNEDGKPYRSSGGEMVDSELGAVPEGWKVGSILEIAELLSGGTPKTKIAEYWGGEIPWVSAKDVTNARGTFILDTEKTITRLGIEHSNTKMLPKNTTIVTARGTVGSYCILSREMTINQTNYGLKAKSEGKDFFVFFSIANLVNQMKMHSYGTVFDTITTKTFKDMKIPIPPELIIKSFDNKVSSIMNQISHNLYESHNLATIRDALLPKLMSGIIRV